MDRTDNYKINFLCEKCMNKLPNFKVKCSFWINYKFLYLKNVRISNKSEKALKSKNHCSRRCGWRLEDISNISRDKPSTAYRWVNRKRSLMKERVQDIPEWIKTIWILWWKIELNPLITIQVIVEALERCFGLI